MTQIRDLVLTLSAIRFKFYFQKTKVLKINHIYGFISLISSLFFSYILIQGCHVGGTPLNVLRRERERDIEAGNSDFVLAAVARWRPALVLDLCIPTCLIIYDFFF